MTHSRVVTLIVSYRSAALTLNALASLEAERRATGLPHEVVVVDNASGDTAVLAAAVNDNHWSDWAFVVTAPRNGGFGYGNNLGMQFALDRGPVTYFHLLNPDTVCRPKAVISLAEFMDAHPQVGITGSSFENADGSDWPIAFRFPTLWSEIEGAVGWGVLSRLLARHVVARVMSPQSAQIDWVAGASMMIRADLAMQLRGFDESYFLYFEETDLCYRALQVGYATWYVPQSRVMHIAGQSTKVTERNAGPVRLPTYWYASRRRYFQVKYGLVYALATDACVLLGLGFGAVKRVLLRQAPSRPLSYSQDLAANSVWRPKFRQTLPFTSGLSSSANASPPAGDHGHGGQKM